LTVASERQIAANRRNARNSSGPRSSAGKKRASHNAYRHGFTARSAISEEFAKAVERLARQIAGDKADVLTLADARAAAQAQFDLARVRQIKVALIEMSAVGELETRQNFKPPGKIKRPMEGSKQGTTCSSEPIEAEVTMPSPEPERTAEAMRLALPELMKLDRYERLAAAIRDRSIQSILDRTNKNSNL